MNLSVDRTRYAEAVLREAVTAGEAYGCSRDGAGRTIAIDYSSPNIAKPFHVGHLRSTIIGGALVRIFEALGHEVVGINHVGDWGTQFGRQIVGLKRFGRPEDADDLMSLNRLYVKFHEEADGAPELVEEGAGMVPPPGGRGRGGAGAVAQDPRHQPRLLQADLRAARRAFRFLHRGVVLQRQDGRGHRGSPRHGPGHGVGRGAHHRPLGGGHRHAGPAGEGRRHHPLPHPGRGRRPVPPRHLRLRPHRVRGGERPVAALPAALHRAEAARPPLGQGTAFT